MKKKYVENQWNRTFGNYPKSKDKRPTIFYVRPYRDKKNNLQYEYSKDPQKDRSKDKKFNKLIEDRLRRQLVDLGLKMNMITNDEEKREKIKEKVDGFLDSNHISGLFHFKLEDREDSLFSKDALKKIMEQENMEKQKGIKNFFISGSEAFSIEDGDPFLFYSMDYFTTQIKPFLDDFSNEEINVYYSRDGEAPLILERPDGFIYSLAPMRIDRESITFLEKFRDDPDSPFTKIPDLQEHLENLEFDWYDPEGDITSGAIEILEDLQKNNIYELKELEKYPEYMRGKLGKLKIPVTQNLSSGKNIPLKKELEKMIPELDPKKNLKRDYVISALEEGILTKEDIGLN